MIKVLDSSPCNANTGHGKTYLAYTSNHSLFGTWRQVGPKFIKDPVKQTNKQTIPITSVSKWQCQSDMNCEWKHISYPRLGQAEAGRSSGVWEGYIVRTCLQNPKVRNGLFHSRFWTPFKIEVLFMILLIISNIANQSYTFLLPGLSSET